ncbi:MAG: CHASE3 domain-containing protein [Burkholderiales bacterium]
MPRRIFLFCILLLSLAALYTIGSAWITVERIGRLQAAGTATAQSQQVLSALHAFATAAVDLESSARGYALAGNDAYLQPFEAARRQAPLRLDELRDLLRDEPKQLARVEQLTPLLAERISISEHAIALKRAAPDEPYVLRFGSRGRESSDEIRRTVEDIEADERQDLATRKSAWQQELERARTTEALSALSSLTVITLSLWALLRLRRTEAEMSAPAPSPLPLPATAPPAPVSPPAADFDALVDETLRRSALLQASHPAGSEERARVEALRETIEAARSGIAPSEALAVMERLGLPHALSALAQAVREREGCTVRESIEVATPPLSAARASLLFRAADWAFAILCAQRRGGEIGVGLATDGSRVVVRVESPLRASMPIDVEQEAQAAKLAQQLATAGGTWQWSAGETGQGLTVTLPHPARAPAEIPETEPARA